MRKAFFIIALLGAALLGLAGYFINGTKNFLNTATQTEGTVIELVGSDTKAPRVAFIDQNGNEHTYKSSVSSSPPSYYVGEKVTVYYDPSNLNKIEIDGFASLWLGSTILAGIGGILFLIGAVPFVIFSRKNSQNKRLKSSGTLVQATFTGTEFGNVSVNNRSPYILCCQWKSPTSDLIYIFKSDYIWFDPNPYIKESQTIGVYIDPSDPKKHYIDLGFLPKLAS